MKSKEQQQQQAVTAKSTTATVAAVSGPKAGSLPSLDEMNKLFESLIDRVQTFGTSSGTTGEKSSQVTAVEVQSDLLSLKAIHRQAYQSLTSHDLESQRKRKLTERKEQQLAALKYERMALEYEILTCRNYQTPFLNQLAREEVVLQQQQQQQTKKDTKDKEKQETNKKLKTVKIKDEQDTAGNNRNNNNNAGEKDDDDDDSRALREFFNGIPIKQDPSKRHVVLARLQEELSARAGLERDLKRRQKELSQIKLKFQQKKQFLDSLPDHLLGMERASLPLQKFVAAASSSSSSGGGAAAGAGAIAPTLQKSTLLLSSERRNRLQRAQTLPAPLYTLFYQLQTCADGILLQHNEAKEADSAAAATATATSNVPPLAVTVSAGGSGGGEGDPAQEQQVLLQFPVPDVLQAITSLSAAASSSSATAASGGAAGDISATTVTAASTPVPASPSATTGGGSAGGGRIKRVTIHFLYHPSQHVITSFATGCATTLNQDVLLADLFQHSDFPAVWTPSASSSTPETATTPATAGSAARPYHWCNYLGGLHQVPEVDNIHNDMDDDDASSQQEQQQHSRRLASTRVILRALRRRVRSNATLKHILHSLLLSATTTGGGGGGSVTTAVGIPTLPPLAAAAVSETIAILLSRSSSTFSFSTPSSTATATAAAANLIHFETAKLLHETVTAVAETAAGASATQLKKTYVATMRQGGRTLVASVTIHMARYPGTPPVWKLQEPEQQQQTPESKTNNKNLKTKAATKAPAASAVSTGNDDDGSNLLRPQLYNERLAKLENCVNYELLTLILQSVKASKQQNRDSSEDDDQKKSNRDTTTTTTTGDVDQQQQLQEEEDEVLDWILVLQLHVILRTWAQYVEEEESEAAVAAGAMEE